MLRGKKSVDASWWLIVLALMLIGFSTTEGQSTLVLSEASGKRAAPDKIYDFEGWSFSIDGDAYEIDKVGKGSRVDSNNRTEKFQLDLAGSDNLARVYFAKHENDILLLCEDETWDAGSGFLTRLDGMTLKPQWRTQIPGFNVANGLIEGDAVYIGAVGFAAKVDLADGGFIWKHDNFYRKYRKDGAFGSFETISITGNEVVYVENQDIFGRAANIIKFDKANGKVVEVITN